MAGGDHRHDSLYGWGKNERTRTQRTASVNDARNLMSEMTSNVLMKQ